MKYFLWLLLVTFATTANVQALVFERDQRADIESARDPKIRDLAKSVFTFIPKSKLTLLKNGSWKFNDQIALKRLVNLCADEPFANNISVGTRCSGALIASNLGLTAGHCVSPLEIPDFCANYYVIFDYIRSGGVDPQQLNATSVYECKRIKKIVYSKETASDDYAILEFSKPVSGRKPLHLRKRGKINSDQEIFMLGYPKGMAQKISEDREVISNMKRSFFYTNLDCFHGNSGSPVFNAYTYEIEGVFVRGGGYVPNEGTDPDLIGDFYPDNAAGCNRTLVCRRADGCAGRMEATRATRIKLQ